MIDYLKAQIEYLKAWYKAVEKHETCFNVNYYQESTNKEAYLMLDARYMFRIPAMFAVIRAHTENRDVPSMQRLFEDNRKYESFPAVYVHTVNSDTVTRNKPTPVKVFQDEHGHREAFDASILDKFIKDTDRDITYAINPKSHLLTVLQYDEPVMIVCGIRPPSGKTW